MAERIVEEYNNGFVWNEALRTARRPALVKAIAAALEAERERCMKLLCLPCRMNWPIREDGRHEEPVRNGPHADWPCQAAAIRRAP